MITTKANRGHDNTMDNSIIEKLDEHEPLNKTEVAYLLNKMLPATRKCNADRAQNGLNPDSNIIWLE